MRKLLLLLGVFATLTLISTQSFAQYRDHRGYQRRDVRVHRYVAPPIRHVAPPIRHYSRPNRNWVPYAVGGLALGALGAGTYYYNNRYCWIETQEVWDRRGRYIGLRDIEVCN